MHRDRQPPRYHQGSSCGSPEGDRVLAYHRAHSPDCYSDESDEDKRYLLQEVEEHGDLELAEDEGTSPEQPASSGLFPLALFKSLLFKAHNAVGLANPAPASEGRLSTTQDPLFVEHTPKLDVVPAPQLFLDNVRCQWSAPASGPMPSSVDKKYFNVAPELSSLLTVPSVDGPVAALYSPNAMPGESDKLLKP